MNSGDEATFDERDIGIRSVCLGGDDVGEIDPGPIQLPKRPESR